MYMENDTITKGEIKDIEKMIEKERKKEKVLYTRKKKTYRNKKNNTVKQNKEPTNIQWLLDVHGIGPKKADELIKKGINSIEDLKKNEDLLTRSQKIGLNYYNDVLKRIPRDEIDEFKKIFDREFNKVKEKDSKYEIVGSYRRGAKTSGDIDLIITSKNPEVYTRFIDALDTKDIILEFLSRGKVKCLVIAKLPGSDVARRVDFLFCSHEEYPFSVLYFTGSKDFNMAIRNYALNLHLSLNEHGLYRKPKFGVKGNKIKKEFETEKDIFDFLHLEYKEPNERINSGSIVSTVPIISDKHAEENNPTCYKSCETVPKRKCATGCNPSWTSKKMKETRNWCHCNLKGKKCLKDICSKK